MAETEKILQMISEGVISVEDGERLLKAISGHSETNSNLAPKRMPSSDSDEGMKEGSKLVVDIQNADGEHVKLNLPLKLAQFAIGMLPKDKLSQCQANGVDLGEILSGFPEILEDLDGDIVNIKTDSGDTIRVFVEK